ncbi:MAG: hypothetical protein Q8P41_26710 [Pseudomonadota bacterium]|nr:hypothetical protein [Pseudomonadota bacterium]
MSEFEFEPTTGVHAATAHVDCPDPEATPIFGWGDPRRTRLDDTLLLLTIFTGREVFIDRHEFDIGTRSVFRQDSRQLLWGGTLRASVEYSYLPPEQGAACEYVSGIETAVNQVLRQTSTDSWRETFYEGHFLFLLKAAFHEQPLQATFTQCWTIWEHLFYAVNRTWLTVEGDRSLPARDKILFLAERYGMMSGVDESGKRRVDGLVGIRNELIHKGRLPARDDVFRDVRMFILMTEFLATKIAGLRTRDIFNTVEKFLEFQTMQDPKRKRTRG